MATSPSRRSFLQATTAAAAGGLILPTTTAAQAQPEPEPEPAPAPKATKAPGTIGVVVWDEQQPAQKEAYPDFLGQRIAAHLKAQPGLSVRTSRLDDPEQGLSAEALEGCRVLVWWGHQRHAEVSPEVGRRLVGHIKAGTLSLLAIHSAHWSTPFMEAMNERARIDLEKKLRAEGISEYGTQEVYPPRRYTQPKADDRLTPHVTYKKFPNNTVEVVLHMPYCCFPTYRGDGKPSQLRVLRPDHPVAAGLPSRFELPHTEMYCEPFHVPEPDEVVLEERWSPGEWFRSGMAWSLGKGRVFYFRPGHETYPVFDDPNALRVVTNAVRWLAASPS